MSPVLFLLSLLLSSISASNGQPTTAGTAIGAGALSASSSGATGSAAVRTEDGDALLPDEPGAAGGSGALGALGAWLGGMSSRIYSRVTASMTNRLDVTQWRQRLQQLVPEYETAPSSTISRHQTKGGEFEIRHYAAQKWVCTKQNVTVQPVEPQTVQWNRTKTMFNSLFLYFSGNNDRKDKLPMTLPIINKFDAFASEPSYQMCFFIPSEYQQKPPTPLQPELQVVQWPARTFISRRFEGLVLYRKGWDEAAFHLEKLAGDENMTGIDFTSYYSVFYDPPVKFWKRQNEIWFEITG